MPNIDYGAGELNRRRSSKSTNLQSVNFDYEYPDGLNFKPGSELHKNIVDKVIERAYASKKIMSRRYDAWKNTDWTLSAYVQLDDKEEKILSYDARKPVSIVFPYSYAIIETLLGYLMAAFFQDPIFRYEGVSPEDTIGAIMMEKVIDLHCNKSKVALALHTQFRDSLGYGFGATSPGWVTRYGSKTVKQETGFMGMLGNFFNQGQRKAVEDNVILFEGNELINIDPYLCLPDTNVSIHKQQDGEFFGWIDRTNYMDLLSEERNNEDLFNVKYVGKLENRNSMVGPQDDSERERKHGGTKISFNESVSNKVDNIHMYVKLIPKEWKLGSGEYPEKWKFTVSADEVLIAAQRLDLDHNMFPVSVAAPDFDGYSSTPVSRIEILSGLQNVLDWLFNAHIANVRKSINDMLIVDPYLVNVKDVEDPKPGKIIRLRRPAWGKGVKDAVQQLQVNDITRAHIADSSWIVQWMQKIGAADDATMGSLRQGGPERLTGAEFEGTQQGAASRLERMAKIIGLQTMQDTGYMFAAHTQQLMSQELYISTTGQWQERLIAEYGNKIKDNKMKVTPFDILVDYDIKVRDGSIPGANYSGIWGKMFELMAQEPNLQSTFDIVRVFKHIARNNGAKNVDEFIKIKPAPVPDEQIQRGIESGNVVPLNQFAGGM